MANEDKVIPVRVALRCRPLVPKEVLEGCQLSVCFVPGEQQIILGRDKAFTFDYTFPCDSIQENLYSTVVADRVEYLFKGYNVTVLAYGQTGSGKTYTMGTAYNSTVIEDESQNGIIQRVIKDIFNGIKQRSKESEFLVKVSFLEVYKEDVNDLLQKNKSFSTITIREDVDGIKAVGLIEQPVTSEEETLLALEQGSLSRTTAATAMNARSSRSHAIFTILLEQRGLTDSSDYTRAKLHLVDLAGSERANKTGALGERFKEGVNINRGLLALGNVISALCDESSHIPYRDSKLTRLLQDSLGGNSHTVMIACISPADSNLDETVNTLRYADRARKIKNKPIVNRDPQNTELMKLRQQVQQLQYQLLQNQSAKVGVNMGLDSAETSENMKILLDRNRLLENENQRLAKELQHALDQTANFCEKSLMNELNKDKLLQNLEDLKSKTALTIEAMNKVAGSDDNEFSEQLDLVKELQNKICELQCEQIRRDHEFSIYSPSKSKQVEVTDEQPQSSSLPGQDCDETSCYDGSETDVREDTFHFESTMKQAALGRELQELERALALKEDLAIRMKESDSHMAVMRIQFENNLKQMEEEINSLQKEKDDLSAALKAAQASANVNKVSEQRRKRLQELEIQIARLKKEMQEKSKIVKMKQDAERKVTALTQEIQALRHARVKLLKQMKEESERYRTWKAQKDREIAQLKQQDRKRQYQFIKMEQQYTKQHSVLRRKMEEAVAANKRLQNALHQQKAVAERRAKGKDSSSLTLMQAFEQELEVYMSTKEAEHHLQNILEDRKTISKELNLLKGNLKSDQPPRKFNKEKEEGESSDHSSEEAVDVNSQIKLLEQDLEMRNVQIADLQQKILDAQQGEKSKSLWNSIPSVECKCAIKWLFDRASSLSLNLLLVTESEKSKNYALENEISSKDAIISKLTEKNNRLVEEMHQIKLDTTEQMAAVERENEKKTLYFLKQLNSSAVSTLSSSCDANVLDKMSADKSRFSYVYEALEKKSEDNERLRQELLSYTKGVKPMFPSILPDGPPFRKKKEIKKSREIMYDSFFEEDVSITDDVNDPDWRLTPILKRNKLSRQTGIFADESSDSETESSSIRAKRTSDISCSCQGNCGTKRCGCKKHNKACTILCKCASNYCCNRDTMSSLSSPDVDDAKNTLNITHVVSDEKRTSPRPQRSILGETSNNASTASEIRDSVLIDEKSRSKTKANDSENIYAKINRSGVLKKGIGHIAPMNSSIFPDI